FFDQIPNGINLERLASDDSPHLCVLGFDLFEPSQIACFHSTVLIAPQSDRIGMNAVSAAQLCRRAAGVELLENPDDLRFAEAAFLHVSLLGPKPGTHSFNLSRFATSGQSSPIEPAERTLPPESLRI